MKKSKFGLFSSDDKARTSGRIKKKHIIAKCKKTFINLELLESKKR